MRRALFAMMVLAAAPAVGAAQAGGAGIKGGLSYGNVSNGGALPGSAGQRTGFAVGVGAVSGGTVGLGLEGLYAQRGITSSFPGDSRNLDYLDVPLYLRVALPTQGLMPYAYAGPQLSYELHCDADGGRCLDSGRPRTTYAGVIGAGLRLGGRSGVSLEGRYIYGLTDLNLGTVSSGDSYRTRSFMVLLGLGF